MPLRSTPFLRIWFGDAFIIFCPDYLSKQLIRVESRHQWALHYELFIVEQPFLKSEYWPAEILLQRRQFRFTAWVNAIISLPT